MLGKVGGKGNSNSGRKSTLTEVGVVEMYKSFIPKVLLIINKKLNSEKETDKKWAVEMASRGLLKMIPQVVQGDKENPISVSIDINKSTIDAIDNYVNSKLNV
jgi:hypothetical protein